MFRMILIQRRMLLAVSFLLLLLPAFFALRLQAADAQPDDIIAFLNQTILWHRQLISQQQLVNEPSDAIFLNDSHEIADQVVQLSFDFARADAPLITAKARATQPSDDPSAAAATSQYQNLVDLTAKSSQRVKETQTELDGLKQQLVTASGKKRQVLESSIAEVQSELDLMTVRRDTLQSMLEVARGAASNGSGSGGLAAKIEELARNTHVNATEEHKEPAGKDKDKHATHDNHENHTPDTTPVAIATASDRKTESGGILMLITDLFELRRKLRLLDTSLEMTDGLIRTSSDLRQPFIATIRTLARRGDDLVGEPDSQDPKVLAEQRKELDSLTAQFKQVSTLAVPLGKQNILLEQYKRNLTNWRNVVQGQYSARAKSLLWRMIFLVAVLGGIFITAELWRRATFRYIQDPRRRHQFLIIRRIIVWPLTAAVIVIAVANGLGSITTFAGLLTAGVAVSLQNVILSVAGYFFLIGKYGVRVGDRIQISGITGDVIDIGLVRMHLAELSSGAGPKLTGRVVAFSNGVVFQPDAAIFKQIPGTNFVWHEVSLSLSPESDTTQVEEKMLECVNRIFSEYKESMERQSQSMERAITVLPHGALQPESRLRITPSGVQVVVRYPVDLEHSGEVDNRVTREVLNATGYVPKLRTVETTPEATPPAPPATKNTESTK